MQFDSAVRIMRIGTLLITLALLAGCGNGRGAQQIPGTPQPSLTGVLVDSPVSGAEWKTSGGRSGLTNGSGEFDYTQPEAGVFVETVTFSIGDIVLGTVPGIPFKGDRLYVTAVELTNSFAPTDRAATNQLVFIQSIDEDQDPTNGITISEATRAAAVGQTLDFDSPDFATEVAAVVAAIAPGNRVVTDAEALDHFYTTYAALGGTDTFDFPFPGYPPVGEGSADFQLVFADEFNTGNAPNPEIWNYDLGYGPNGFGWGNDEWQLYTDSSENIRIEDGNLVITALCPVEPCGVRDGTITSARITTLDNFEFRYGKVVARIKMPVGQGTWPAFWSLGANFPDVGWPRSGEIDFVEVFNNTYNSPADSATAERTTTSAMHWCDERIVPNPSASCFGEGGRIFDTARLDTGGSLGDDFQIWEADWTADRVTVSINGIQYFELEIDPATMEEFRREFFLILNVAMGGTLGSGGEPPQGDETFPQTMLVDYVRVYQQVDDISPPELTDVTIASSNADPAFAKTGDTVTVSLTANEPIVAPTVTIGGIAATTVAGSGANWQASRALTAADTEGVIEFSIEYVDAAGNAGVPVSTTTDLSSVTADVTAPALNIVTIASDNVDPGLATTGDIVTVTLAANEAIVAPTVTIGGVAAVPTGSGANWQASRAVTAGEDGVIAFSIAYADAAGNAGVPVSMTTDASSVTVNTTAPTVTVGGAPAMFMNLAPIPLTFTFSEPVTGFDVAGIPVTNGSARNLAGSGASYTADVVPTGLGNLIIGVAAGAAADVAGNPNMAAANVSVTSALDSNAPVLTFISIRSNNANPAFATTGDVVTILIGAPEAITQPTVTIAGAPANVTGSGQSWQATRTALVTDPDGPVAFSINNFQAIDDGTPGYESTVTTDGSAVVFDASAPTLSIDGLPATIDFLDPIAVTFQFDEDVSGFEVGDIQVTNGTLSAFVVVDPATYTADVTPDGAGDLTVAVADDVATDSGGNGNIGASETRVVDSAWGLVWSDDFEVAGLDAGNWTARTDADCPDPCDGAQTYQTERVTVANGLLTINALAGAPYTSGVIDSADKRALKFGRVEIDARMPGADFTLPSLRLLPAIPQGETQPVYGPWPQSGEIDLVDAPNLGPGNSALEHTLRYGLPAPEDTATTVTTTAPGVPTLDLIEYAIEWEGGEIRWFVNGVHVATQTQDNWYAYFEDADGVYTLGTDAAPFDQEFYVAIGLAVDDNSVFAADTLEIDAVRVYECVNPVNPAFGTGCSTGTGVPPAPGASAPYTEALSLFADGLATLDFEEPGGATTSVLLNTAALPFDTSNTVVSNPNAVDGANTVWNADIQAVVGRAAVVIDPGGFDPTPGASLRYFDLSGGEAAGELLFRMRVNTATAGVQLFVQSDDRDLNAGQVTIVDDASQILGQWRNYSVKLADLVADSSGTLDVADIFAFEFNAVGGNVNFDLDDISVKVACRDTNGCEATPRSAGAPPTIVYSEDFEGVTIDDPIAVSGEQPAGAGISSYFADVWGPNVNDPALVGIDTPLYTYFGDTPNAAAPGIPPGFAAIATGDGGPAQGLQYLSVFSDYNNGDQLTSGSCGPSTCTVNTSIFREPFDFGNRIGAGDLNFCWTFSFDARSNPAGGIADATVNNGGNFLQAPTSASAFLKTLDPDSNFDTTNDIRVDMTVIGTSDWARYSMNLDLSDPALEGQILQFGFNVIATQNDATAVFYDNLEVTKKPGACPASP
ncbi:MAG: Ig-like domain-containing protein [Gammaproteobacteria bacterium]